MKKNRIFFFHKTRYSPKTEKITQKKKNFSWDKPRPKTFLVSKIAVCRKVIEEGFHFVLLKLLTVVWIQSVIFKWIRSPVCISNVKLFVVVIICKWFFLGFAVFVARTRHDTEKKKKNPNIMCMLSATKLVQHIFQFCCECTLHIHDQAKTLGGKMM